jgi:hypothetical protein
MGLRFVAAVIAFSPILLAQDGAGEVRGRVVSSRGNEPLGQVQVTLTGAPLSMPLRAVTADDGSFRIPAVPPGDYVLQTAAVDFYVVVRVCFTWAKPRVRCCPDVPDRSVQDTVVSQPRFRRGYDTIPRHHTRSEERKISQACWRTICRGPQPAGRHVNNDFDSEFPPASLPPYRPISGRCCCIRPSIRPMGNDNGR